MLVLGFGFGLQLVLVLEFGFGFGFGFGLVVPPALLLGQRVDGRAELGHRLDRAHLAQHLAALHVLAPEACLG